MSNRFATRGRFFAVALSMLFLSLAACSLRAQDSPSAGTLVFDFESGDLGQEGWSIVHGANTQPIGEREFEFNRPNTPYQKHGKRYLTTLESAERTPTDAVYCIMESPVFTIKGDKITFLIGGGGSREGERVELALLADDGEVAHVLNARG